jgi:hypothetical protein
MDNNMVEQMKKIIADKQKKSAQQGMPKTTVQKIGETQKGVKRRKQGGMFDK